MLLGSGGEAPILLGLYHGPFSWGYSSLYDLLYKRGGISVKNKYRWQMLLLSGDY